MSLSWDGSKPNIPLSKALQPIRPVLAVIDIRYETMLHSVPDSVHQGRSLCLEATFTLLPQQDEEPITPDWTFLSAVTFHRRVDKQACRAMVSIPRKHLWCTGPTRCNRQRKEPNG
jgi:hypothetical protein